MSILEDIFSSFIGGIVAFAGIVMWILLILFGNGIMDQAIVVGNLITTFILVGLWIHTIVEWIIDLVKDKQQKNSNRIFTIIKIVIRILIFIGFFIYGYTHPYNNLVFHYSYIPIFSAIHTMWIPALVLFLINGVVGKGKVTNKISGLLGIIGMWLLAILVSFFIGQIITGCLGFFWGIDETKGLYNNICYYENLGNPFAREYDEVLEDANEALDKYRSDLKNQNQDNSIANIIELLMVDPDFKDDYLSEYRLTCWDFEKLENGDLKYIIRDNEEKEHKWTVLLKKDRENFEKFVE